MENAKIETLEQAQEQAQETTLEQFNNILIKIAQTRSSSRAKATSDIKCFTFSNDIYSLERTPKHVFKLVIKEPNATDKQRTCDGSSLTQELAQELKDLLSKNYKPFCKDVATELEVARIKLELAIEQAQAIKDKAKQEQALAQAKELYAQVLELEPTAQSYIKAKAQELKS